MQQFKVGDRVSFNFDGIQDTGEIVIVPVHPSVYYQIKMDTCEGHGSRRDRWNVPFDKLTLLKPKKIKVFK